MDWQVTVFVTPILLAVLIALFLMGYAVVQLKDGRRQPIVIIFFWITVGAVIWPGFSALKLLHTDPEMKLLFYRLLHVGAAALPPLIFLFVVAYTDRQRWLRPELIAGIFVLPAAFVALLFIHPEQLIIQETRLITNDLVILRVEDGPGFFVFSIYSIFLGLTAIGLVFGEATRIGRTYYPQAALITIGVLVPMLFSAKNAADVPPFVSDTVNFVPTSAAVSTAALGILLVRYRLFALPPLAYATAMKHAPQGLFVVDRHERVVLANGRGQRILDRLDVTLDDKLTPHLDVSHPDAASGELIEIPNDDGQSAFYRLFVEPLIRGGRRVGWVVVLNDETIQQRQQQQLQRQNDQLDAFARTVSHDLRNPLTVAEGRLELAKESGEPEHFEAVTAAHERMGVMINQLLGLARSRGSLETVQPVPVAKLATECWALVDHPDASVEVADGFNLVVEGDRQRLSQLFENLFLNAIDHSAGAVTIRVGELPDRTGFFIEDDGSGIPEEQREQIFEPGYTTQNEGTGFGLAIVHEVIQAHEWDIDVVEGELGGARFEISGVDVVD